MRHLKNTLYLNIEGLWISRDGDCLVVHQEGVVLKSFPIHILESIVCFGFISLSSDAMDLCVQNDVAVNYLSVYGRFMARITGPARGNVFLRRAQFQRANDPEACIELARSFLIGKIANGRTLLLRHARESDSPIFERSIRETARWLERLRQGWSDELPQLLGNEGEAASLSFECFDAMILKNKEHFKFTQRTRRPPRDPINALLSLGYALLASNTTSALESVGLDASVGFLHRDRSGRPSLALDLMEELRVPLVDRFVLALVNREQIRPEHFSVDEIGAVRLTDEACREIFLPQWQERKREEITHPFLDEKIPIGLLPHVQAMLLAQTLRGDLDAYPPYFLR